MAAKKRLRSELLLLCFMSFHYGYSLKEKVDNADKWLPGNSSTDHLVQDSIDNVKSSNNAKTLHIVPSKKTKEGCKMRSGERSDTSSLLSHLIQSTNHVNKELNNASKDGGNKSVRPLWLCKPFPLTQQSVIILNNKSSLVDWLEKINQTMGCAVVLFYAKWCYFSATLAPLYNAVGRTFQGLPILALDVYTHNSLNNRYGIVGVPTILLFHESRPVSRFNRSRTLKELVEFIHENTGMEYNRSVELTAEDYFGPLLSTPSAEPNYYLLASLFFVVSVVLVILWRLGYIQLLLDHVPSLSLVTRLFARRVKQE